MHGRLRLPLRLGQIVTLCLWDVASNAKNEYRTQSLRLRQIANKNAKNAQCERTFRSKILQ